MHTFRDLETAAYCPRKLYYRRRSAPPDVPEEVTERRDLAFAYERLLDGDGSLSGAPLAVSPATVRERLERHRRELDAWASLADPAAREVHLAGRDARGVAHKVLDDPVAPALAFAGDPPDEGVWRPQSVRLVAAAKALAWERERPVERAFAEYPAHGVVRPIEVTTRRTAAYRRAVRTADAIDGPPGRVDDARCEPCEYRDRCGTKRRTLGNLLP